MYTCYDGGVMWERNKIPLLIFCVAVLVRAVFFPLIPESGNIQFMGITADGYYEIAEHVMGGEGFRRDGIPPAPDSMRMPFYPYFIVALVTVFGSYYALFVAQVLLGAVNAVLAWFIAKEMLPGRWAIAVGVVIAFEPFTAFLTRLVMTETLFMFFFLSMTWGLLQFLRNKDMRFLICATFLLGAATLVRPTTQYFPGLVLLTLAASHGFRLNKGLIKQSSVVLGIFFLSIAPWAIRNHVTFGTSELTAQPASNLFFAFTSSVIALDTDVSYEEARTALFKREGVTKIDDITLATADHFKERAIAEIKKHPVGLAKTIGIALMAFFTHDAYVGILDHYGVPMNYTHPGIATLITNPGTGISFVANMVTRPEILVIVGRLVWILVTCAAITGGILYLIHYGLSAHFILFAGTIAYFALTSTVLGLAVTGRFRVPVNPFIFMFAAYTLMLLYKKYKTRLPTPLLASDRVSPQHLLKE